MRFAASVLLLACSGDPRPVIDAGPPGSDGGGGLDGSSSDGGIAGDGGNVQIGCAYDAPHLVITRDDVLHGRSSATLRLALRAMGEVNDLRVMRVDERIGDAMVRAWDVATLAAPPGFDGRLLPREGMPSPTVLFLGATDATEEELAVCALDPWARGDGSLEVTVSTRETGEVSFSCPLGLAYAGRGPEPIRVSCAEGVPGFLRNARMSDIVMPVTASVIDSEIVFVNSGAAAVDAFGADVLAARTHTETFPIERACADPATYMPGGGRHDLWRGRTSSDVWSGPVAPRTEERVNWFWQIPGELLPAGFCIAPDPMPVPGTECLRPVISLEVGGTSSVGRWRFESALFDCYDTP
jgi:hypothetical protein